MSQNQSSDAKDRLLKMREEVLKEVRQLANASNELGQDGVPDIGDMSVNTYSRDVLLNLSEAQRRKLNDINVALERVEAGEYGICLRCGEDIAPKRMEVRPFSRYCVECKGEVERFGE